MEPQPSVKIFLESVPQVFRFLETDYGLKLLQKDDWAFEASSEKIVVEIGLDFPGVYIALREPYEKKIYEPDTKTIGFSWIMQAFHSDIHFSEIYMNSSNQIPEELKRQADIFKVYGVEFLKGDFSRWPQLLEFVEKNKFRFKNEK